MNLFTVKAVTHEGEVKNVFHTDNMSEAHGMSLKYQRDLRYVDSWVCNNVMEILVG